MLTIIGCGNPNRSDDGAGVEVVRRLADALGDKYSDRLRIFDAGTDGMGVMFKARGATSLILVDACRSGSDAGAVFEVPGHELEGAAATEPQPARFPLGPCPLCRAADLQGRVSRPTSWST